MTPGEVKRMDRKKCLIFMEDCAFIATGHYARIEVDGEGLSHLLPAADAEADQSAALAGLPQEVLAKLVLPLGEFTKAEVAEMLADTAE